MTKEEFIQKAREIHGDKYDYSKVEKNVTYKEKIKIICHEKDDKGLEHGEFWQRHYDHLRGNGCKKCMSKKNKAKLSSKKEEFIQKAREIHGDKYDYSKVEYINNKTKVCIICPEHGEFWQTPMSHLQGKGCVNCIRKVHDIESFIQKAREIHGDKYDYSKVEYIDYNKPVCIICPEHGEFWQTPHNHRCGRGCKKCGIISSKNKQKKSIESFIQKAREIHGDKYDYSKVEYINSYTPVTIICPIHGEFWQKPHSHLNNCGCQKCKESKCEKEVRRLLQYNDIKYVYQASKSIEELKWLGKQTLDFYLPFFKLAIECQGRQHFEPINFFGGIKGYLKNKENDYKKKKLCKEHNIKILYFAIDGRCKKFDNDNTLIFDKAKLLKKIYGK